MEKQLERQLSNDRLEIKSSDAVTVSCSVCQHQVPLSAAISREASDYVEYYCGLDCYEEWRKRSSAFI